MRRFSATDAKNRFGELIEASRDAPVAIERHGRVVAYVVAPAPTGATAGTSFRQLAGALRAIGAQYATVFGSVAHGEARPGSDIDLAVFMGGPLTTSARIAVVDEVVRITGRSVDLVDLHEARGLVLLRALGGAEIVCKDAATRTAMILRGFRADDDVRAMRLAARSARAGLFS
jgi:prevent-host-death family protein